MLRWQLKLGHFSLIAQLLHERIKASENEKIFMKIMHGETNNSSNFPINEHQRESFLERNGSKWLYDVPEWVKWVVFQFAEGIKRMEHGNKNVYETLPPVQLLFIHLQSPQRFHLTVNIYTNHWHVKNVKVFRFTIIRCKSLKETRNERCWRKFMGCQFYVKWK